MARVLEGTLGGRIRKARGHAGLTQLQLAGRIGADRIQVSKWERGRNEPTLRYLRRISETTGVSVQELVGGDDGDDDDGEESDSVGQRDFLLAVERLMDERINRALTIRTRGVEVGA